MRNQKNAKMTPKVAEAEQVLNQKAETVEIPAGQESMEPETKKAVIVSVGLVNVREYASPDAPVVGYVRKDEVVTVLGYNNNYRKIQFGGDRVGYIPLIFCKEV